MAFLVAVLTPVGVTRKSLNTMFDSRVAANTLLATASVSLLIVVGLVRPLIQMLHEVLVFQVLD